MIERFPSTEALADAVAERFIVRAAGAIAATGRFVVALSGGSTPREAYARLATDPLRGRVDWGWAHVVWGDERCVPPDDPRSNYRMAKEALLDQVPIPPAQIHRMRGEDDPEQAAAHYERQLRTLVGREGSPGVDSTTVDLVLLGLGEDGHTASLFPGQAAVKETARWVVAVTAPDGIMRRITLTPALINTAREVIFVVSGESKAAILERVRQGSFNPDQLPAQAIRPVQGRLVWMVDEAAASRVPPTRV